MSFSRESLEVSACEDAALRSFEIFNFFLFHRKLKFSFKKLRASVSRRNRLDSPVRLFFFHSAIIINERLFYLQNGYPTWRIIPVRCFVGCSFRYSGSSWSSSSKVSFPGGKIDQTDVNEVATALREMEEEIFLSASVFQLFCCVKRFFHFLFSLISGGECPRRLARCNCPWDSRYRRHTCCRLHPSGSLFIQSGA